MYSCNFVTDDQQWGVTHVGAHVTPARLAVLGHVGSLGQDLGSCVGHVLGEYWTHFETVIYGSMLDVVVWFAKISILQAHGKKYQTHFFHPVLTLYLMSRYIKVSLSLSQSPALEDVDSCNFMQFPGVDLPSFKKGPPITSSLQC